MSKIDIKTRISAKSNSWSFVYMEGTKNGLRWLVVLSPGFRLRQMLPLQVISSTSPPPHQKRSYFRTDTWTQFCELKPHLAFWTSYQQIYTFDSCLKLDLAVLIWLSFKTELHLCFWLSSKTRAMHTYLSFVWNKTHVLHFGFTFFGSPVNHSLCLSLCISCQSPAMSTFCISCNTGSMLIFYAFV